MNIIEMIPDKGKVDTVSWNVYRKDNEYIAEIKDEYRTSDITYEYLTDYIFLYKDIDIEIINDNVCITTRKGKIIVKILLAVFINILVSRRVDVTHNIFNEDLEDLFYNKITILSAIKKGGRIDLLNTDISEGRLDEIQVKDGCTRYIIQNNKLICLLFESIFGRIYMFEDSDEINPYKSDDFDFNKDLECVYEYVMIRRNEHKGGNK